MSIVHILTFAGPPSGAPLDIGQHWIDTLNKITYMSVGTSTVADWVAPPSSQIAANSIKGNNTGSTATGLDLSVAQVKTMLNLAGSNTGDQTITLTGGVTGSGTGSFAATVVTNANLTGGVTSVGNATTVVTNANLTGGVTSIGNVATVITNANLTGPITSVGNATTVTANSITNAMAAQMAANTIKGNNTAGLANAADLTVVQTKTMLALDLVTNTADSTKLARYITPYMFSASHTAAQVAGTYALTVGGNPAVVSGGSSAYPIAIIDINSGDFPAIGALTAKLRLKCTVSTNDTAPGGNFTFGLYPVTRPATSGGTGVCIYTLGTVVAGSNGAVATTPAVDTTVTATGVDFALPANGTYAVGVVTSLLMPALAHVQMNAVIQTRYT